jgi:hypothetical protein
MLRRSLAFASFALLFAVPVASAATIVPTRFDDPIGPAGLNCPSDCSLRGAIASANSGDTISLAAGAYNVAIAEVPVHGDVEVVGAGARATSITSTGSRSLLHVFSGGSADFKNLSLANGEGTLAGALWNQGTVGMSGVSITNNVGTDSDAVLGGAINNSGVMVLNSSTVASNSAEAASTDNAYGGGVYNSGFLIVNNSTFHGNTVEAAGGFALGGAVYGTPTSQNFFYNVTFGSGNDAIANAEGNSLGGQGYTQVGALWLIANTVFADSVGPAYNDTCSVPTTASSSLGGNVEPTNGDCGSDLATDRLLADPGLGAFGNNGGQTDTQLISATGPAAGLGLLANCDNSAFAGMDQRGGLRPQAAGCDSGAVELNSLAGLVLTGSFGKVKYGSPVTYALTITNSGPDPIFGATISGTTCAIGPLAVGASASCTGSITWNGDSVISQTFTASGNFNDPTGSNSLTLTALAPRLTSVSLRPPKVTPTKSGATLGTKKVKGAATLKYKGIDLSSLSVPIQAPIKGNIKSGKCVKRKSGTKPKGKSCVIWKTLTTVTVKKATTSGTLYFTGRVKQKKLKKGNYRLALTAQASNGNVGSPWYLKFSVK